MGLLEILGFKQKNAYERFVELQRKRGPLNALTSTYFQGSYFKSITVADKMAYNKCKKLTEL
jgi:cell division protein FtsI/penicillin-binding protein 2